MSKRDEQLARMKGLMTYGMVSENKKTPVKDSIEGPDGNVYAIIREGAKYYIKSTPKGSALVTESFDYIGGFMNKKANEFSSYNQASKNLELKVRSLNEAYGVNKTVEMLNPEKKETLMVEMTDAMKASLARYRQIMNNAAGIMNESAISPSNTGVPEAPKTTGFSPKLGGPFTNGAEAKLDKDLNATAGDPEKQSEPFGENGKAEPFKDAQYVPAGSVANKKPSGGKVVRVNENEDYVETLEECDEWGSCGLPASAGTGEIGDTAPFEKKVNTQLDEDSEFAGVAATAEGEDEEDIDLDDIDLDLDSEEEPSEDEELDDIDADDEDVDVDDEDVDVDDEDIEFDDEDDIESLKNRVEELEDLVAQLLGDEYEYEDEPEYELELDSDDEDFEDDEDFGDEDMDMLSEDYVNYANPKLMAKWTGPLKSFDGREPNEDDSNGPFARRKTTDATHKDTIQIRVLDQIKAWRQEIIDELKASKKVASPEEVKKIEQSEVDYELKFNNIIESINRIVRSFENSKYYIGNKRDGNGEGDWGRQDLDKIIVTIERESDYLTHSLAKLGLDSEEVDKLIGEADRWVKSLTTILYNLEDKESTSTNWDFADTLSNKFNVKDGNSDVEDEEDVEVEDDYEKKKKKDEFADLSDDEKSERAYAAASKFDPSDLELASVTPRRLNEEGTRLNVFGKHPGYRKKPMTLPATGSDEGDWNDDSVYSEQPFGQEIGDSAPFEKVIKASVDSIMESLKKKL